MAGGISEVPRAQRYRISAGDSGRRYYCVRGYIPPSDVSTIQYIGQAFDRLPKGRSIL
jgi:hypothetical protein